MDGEMELFHNHFPEIAEQETRSVLVLDRKDIAPGNYAFIDLYCSQKDCDCRNVMINVVERSRGHRATIDHALDVDGFKDVGMPRTFLDPFNTQSKESPALLRLFKELSRDKAYAQRLERHYQMVKEKVNHRPEGTFLKAFLSSVSSRSS